MKCLDCNVDYECMGEWDEKGNPLNICCFSNACPSCEEIRMGLGKCRLCGIRLTGDNKWNKDPYAKYCQSCWDKCEELPDPVFHCPDCNSELEQDPENLFELWCGECLEVKISLNPT